MTIPIARPACTGRWIGCNWRICRSETPYFYLAIAQEYPAIAGSDYLLADLTGSGYYGDVMSVMLAQNGCWRGRRFLLH